MNADRRNVSPHFTNYEYACKCSDPDCFFGGADMHPKILSGAEKLRALACEVAGEDVPLRVISGGRCGPHNKAEGGHPNSQHMRGAAVDLQSRNPKVSNARLATLAFDVPEFANGGIGINENTLHLDVGHKTTWFYTDLAEKLFNEVDMDVADKEAAEISDEPKSDDSRGMGTFKDSPFDPATVPVPAPKPAPKKTAKKPAGKFGRRRSR